MLDSGWVSGSQMTKRTSWHMPSSFFPKGVILCWIIELSELHQKHVSKSSKCLRLRPDWRKTVTLQYHQANASVVVRKVYYKDLYLFEPFIFTNLVQTRNLMPLAAFDKSVTLHWPVMKMCRCDWVQPGLEPGILLSASNVSPRAGHRNWPKKSSRLSKHTDMTIHWKAFWLYH
jgi:hypothetical protein